MSEYTKRSSSKDYGDKGDKYGSRSYKDKDQDDRYMDDMDDGMDDGRKGRKFSNGMKKKECRFMSGEEDTANLNYKNPRFLATFMTEHGRIVPRRVTGNCATIQRKLTQEIKRARILALVGYTSVGPNAG